MERDTITLFADFIRCDLQGMNSVFDNVFIYLQTNKIEIVLKIIAVPFCKLIVDLQLLNNFLRHNGELLQVCAALTFFILNLLGGLSICAFRLN